MASELLEQEETSINSVKIIIGVSRRTVFYSNTNRKKPGVMKTEGIFL